MNSLGINYNFTAANIGFGDVSAVATYDIQSSVLNKLFYFQLDKPYDASGSMNIVNYGINASFKFNIGFSQSNVTATDYVVDNAVSTDYVRYLAYTIMSVVGKTTDINIFNNSAQLSQGLINMDRNFNNNINERLQSNTPNVSTIFLSNDTTNPFIKSSQELVTEMLTFATPERLKVFQKDLINQPYDISNTYWVPFHSGDQMSVLIHYLTNYNIKPRNYKIILNCIAPFIFPYSVTNVGYNIKGNLDPFYVLYQYNLYTNSSLNMDASFVSEFNSIGPNINLYRGNNILPFFQQIGITSNLMDFYYKTFRSKIKQPSLLNDNGIKNNGLNLSFQYIYLNSTITKLFYPSLRAIKQALLTSYYNAYPTLNDIKDIQCDLNCDASTNFVIRIYTRPAYSNISESGINNILYPNDNFYGNYYDSIQNINPISTNLNYNTYHLNDLFPYWSAMLSTVSNTTVYYNGKVKTLGVLGQQQILSICILTYNINANIGIKNIVCYL
jgi:hypothetical protein